MIKRLLFGCVWFVIFWIGFGAVGGGLAGAAASSRRSQEGRPVVGFQEGYQTGYAAGREFHERYGKLVNVAAIVCAVLGTAAGVLPGTGKDNT